MEAAPLAVSGLVLGGLLVWQPVALAAGYLTWRVASNDLGSRAAALVAGLAVVGALALLPLQVSKTARELRLHARMDRDQAERYGAHGRPFNVAVVDKLRGLIPPEDTYYIQAGRPAGSAPFRFWSLGWLLPRTAAETPSEADWIISWYADPGRAGVRYASLTKLSPATYLGRVAR